MAAGRNAKRLAETLPPPQLAGPVPQCWTEPATVATVTAGAAADGNALVTVSWRGGTYAVPYPSHYAPVVGHVVRLLVQPPQVSILDRPIGTP